MPFFRLLGHESHGLARYICQRSGMMGTRSGAPTTINRINQFTKFAASTRPELSRREFSNDSATSSSSTSSASSSSSSSFTSDPELAGLFKNPIVQELWKARQEAKKKRMNGARSAVKADVKGDLNGRHPRDSRVQVTYHFSTDKYLLEAYRSPWGQMRLGRLMEDLDALAGNIAFFHVDDQELSTGGDIDQEYMHPTIVTASVDRIRLRHRPSVELDQHLAGQVTWTGTSSMEIRMHCTTDGETEPWLEAYVTFVTLHPVTKKPVPIHPLLPETAEEKAEFEAGARRAAVKKQRRKMQNAGGGSLVNEQIAKMAHQLLAEAGPLLNMPSLADPHSILMQQTKIQNALIAQPQVQNLHNRIFGGFLVRRAFELSFSNAYLFGGALPLFLEVDEVSFWSPVDVGDLLVFNSRVLYTDRGFLRDYYCYNDNNTSSNCTADISQDEEELPIVHIEVEAWVAEPEKATARLSNQFYFTFAIQRQKGSNNMNQHRVRKVLPSNIDEARRMASRILGDHEQQEHDKGNI